MSDSRSPANSLSVLSPRHTQFVNMDDPATTSTGRSSTSTSSSSWWQSLGSVFSFSPSSTKPGRRQRQYCFCLSFFLVLSVALSAVIGVLSERYELLQHENDLEKRWQPEADWGPPGQPGPHEVCAFAEISHPGPQGCVGWKGHLLPAFWYLHGRKVSVVACHVLGICGCDLHAATVSLRSKCIRCVVWDHQLADLCQAIQMKLRRR